MKNIYYKRFMVGIFLLVWFSAFNIQAQNKNRIECRYNPDNQKYYIKYIDFINNTTGEKEAVFNIREHNPYNKLDFPILNKKNGQNNKYYQINNIRIKDFRLSKGKFKFRNELSDTITIINGSATSYSAVFTSDTSHIIVQYNMILYQNETFLGMSTTVYILSNEGSVLHIFDEFDSECLSPAVTENGKYFAYGYGGGNDEEGNSLSGVGYAIIDLDTKEMIVNEKVGELYNIALPHNYGNLIRINCKKYESRTYIVYDFDKKKKYTKTYPFDEIVLMKKVTNQGFIFEENYHSGIYRTDYFEKSFIVGEIK